MKTYYYKLCLLLLEEHFGSIIQSIAVQLLEGTKTLRTLCFNTHLPLAKVKEGLCVLLKYGFVTCQETENVMEYMLHHDKIIMMLRYPKYIFFVKSCCGNEAEMILEEILKNGCLTASEVIINIYKQMQKTNANASKEVSLSSLKNAFELLVKNQFLMRSLSFKTTETDKPDYNFPTLDLQVLHCIIEGQEVDSGDSKIYWKVNIDRFVQDFRDQIVVSAMTQRFDDNAGKLMQQLFNLMYMRTASWAATSNPIPYTEIKEAVRKLENAPKLEQYLDEYLQIMQEDNSQFIKRVGDSGGGQYSINMANAFKQLAWATLEDIVMERFGSKSARIFRVLRKENDASLEQIQQLVMIPAREVKCLVYILVQQNFIQMVEQRKGGSSTVKTFFRCFIDVRATIKMQIEHCCQALYNIIKKRIHESISNKRMIEKQMRVQILSAKLNELGGTEQQLADIADMITPSETEQLEKAQNAINRLTAAELHIDETLFLFTMYFRYY